MRNLFLLMCMLFPFNVLEAQVHVIGERFGGGVVFSISADSLHGLIIETVDQSKSCDWEDAQIAVKAVEKHSDEGKKFNDWELPTIEELNLLYINLQIKDLCSAIIPLCFEGEYYWSSVKYIHTDWETGELGYDYAYFIQLSDGRQSWEPMGISMAVRAVRKF